MSCEVIMVPLRYSNISLWTLDVKCFCLSTLRYFMPGVVLLPSSNILGWNSSLQRCWDNVEPSVMFCNTERKLSVMKVTWFPRVQEGNKTRLRYNCYGTCRESINRITRTVAGWSNVMQRNTLSLCVSQCFMDPGLRKGNGLGCTLSY